MHATLRTGAATVACFLLLTGDLRAQEPSSSGLSLPETLARFHANSPRLEIARARLRSDLGRARQGTAIPNPTLSGTHEDLGAYSESYLLVNQPLAFLWERGARSERADALARESRARFMADSTRLVVSVKKAWVDAGAARSAAAALRTTAAVFDGLVADAEARVAEGDLAGYDLRRLRWERARLASRLALAEVTLEEAERELGALISNGDGLMRVAAGDAVEASPPEIPTDPLSLAMARRADLAAADASIEALSADAGLVGRSWLTGTTATGGVKTQADGQDGWFVGFEVPVPLTDRRGAAREAAAADVNEAMAQRDALARAITLDVRRAESRLSSARMQARLVADVATGDGEETLLEIARLAYDEGEIGIVELLDAARAWLDARTLRDRIRADAWMAYFDLEAAVGGFEVAAETGGNDR